MSRNRDKNADLAATKRLMQTKGGHAGSGSLNWLGHRIESGAAKIDQLLLTGASMDQLARCRGAVNEHLEHLRIEHGLRVLARDGLYRFSFNGLPATKGADGSPGVKMAKQTASSRASDKNAGLAAAAGIRPLREAKTSFDGSYIKNASRVFLRPTAVYSWCDIVSGIDVCLRGRNSQRMSAVAANTFRASA